MHENVRLNGDWTMIANYIVMYVAIAIVPHSPVPDLWQKIRGWKFRGHQKPQNPIKLDLEPSKSSTVQ